MVVLASGGKSCCTRSGQSAEVLSQKRHRLGLGTRLASMYAAMLRLKFPRLVTKSSSAASAATFTVWWVILWAWLKSEGVLVHPR